MTEIDDKIGVVRQHRWVSAEAQAKILKPRCRIVVSLGGGKERQVTRAELERLVRPGTVIEFLHVYLLADPHKRSVKGGMKADFAAALKRLVDDRGGTVVDVDAGLTTAKDGHRRAMIALAEDQIGRANKGLKSALNGARSKGRPAAKFTAEQLKDAKAVWRNLRDYPTWLDAEKAFPEGFTAARAFKMWRGRR